jgi:hypothetical protein
MSGWANLWAAHTSAPREVPEAERPPLGPDDPIAEWESPTQFFERTAASTPAPAPRRSRAKGDDD